MAGKNGLEILKTIGKYMKESEGFDSVLKKVSEISLHLILLITWQLLFGFRSLALHFLLLCLSSLLTIFLFLFPFN